MAREHFQRSGFGEIRTPLLETTDLFCRGIGEGTDVVGKEMYSFQDRGDRSCTLRPEGTASVVRAALQHGLLSQGAQKLWYAWVRCFATSAPRPDVSGSFTRSVWSGLGRSVPVAMLR